MEGTLASPTEQQANALVATTTMDAKLMVATGSGNVQQLKDLVKEESQMVVVVMARQHAASVEKPQPQQGNMDPHLLALASSGSAEKLQALLNGEDGQSSSHSTDRSLTTRPVSSYGDTEANVSILEGKGSLLKVTLHSMWWPPVVRVITSLTGPEKPNISCLWNKTTSSDVQPALNAEH